MWHLAYWHALLMLRFVIQNVVFWFGVRARMFWGKNQTIFYSWNIDCKKICEYLPWPSLCFSLRSETGLSRSASRCSTCTRRTSFIATSRLKTFSSLPTNFSSWEISEFQKHSGSLRKEFSFSDHLFIKFKANLETHITYLWAIYDNTLLFESKSHRLVQELERVALFLFKTLAVKTKNSL